MGFLAFVLFVAVIVLAILLFKARKRVDESESKIRILNSSLITQTSKVSTLTSKLEIAERKSLGNPVREAATKLSETVRTASRPYTAPKPAPARSKASSTPRPQSSRRSSSSYDDNTTNAFLFGALASSSFSDSDSGSSRSSSYDSGSSSSSSYSDSSSSSSSSSSYSDSGSSYSDSGSF